jgi:hypothetical protein
MDIKILENQDGRILQSMRYLIIGRDSKNTLFVRVSSPIGHMLSVEFDWLHLGLKKTCWRWWGRSWYLNRLTNQCLGIFVQFSEFTSMLDKALILFRVDFSSEIKSMRFDHLCYVPRVVLDASLPILYPSQRRFAMRRICRPGFTDLGRL